MERGAACVTLTNACSEFVRLPDAADKSIEEQINDAICAATGFVSSNVELNGERSESARTQG